jgi:mono/diheme cytochrome c family protein
MFRLAITVSLIALALATACGGGSSGGGSSSAGSSSSSGASGSASASAQGKKVFASAGCKGCHTLKDAGATGSVGPNLDDVKPDTATVKRQVINGGGPMPAFKGRLSDAQIQAVSTYVSTVAGQS